MKENKVTVKAYKDAIERIVEGGSRRNLEYFSVREIEPLLGVEIIPAPDELFEALEQLGLEYSATLCPTDILIRLEVPEKFQKLQMDELKIPTFYHITHINNLYSIFQEGLLCKNLLKEKGLDSSDISSSEIQDRRHEKVVGGVNLHSYAPLYFDHPNPMTVKVICNHKVDDLCFICTSKEILSIDGVYFSDGNAAADGTNFYRVDEKFEIVYKLLEKVKDAKSWGRYKDLDNERYRTYKRIRCAEVLVPDKIPISMFKGIVVPSKMALKKVGKDIKDNVGVIVNKSFFHLK